MKNLYLTGFIYLLIVMAISCSKDTPTTQQNKTKQGMTAADSVSGTYTCYATLYDAGFATDTSSKLSYYHDTVYGQTVTVSADSDDQLTVTTPEGAYTDIPYDKSTSAYIFFYTGSLGDYTQAYYFPANDSLSFTYSEFEVDGSGESYFYTGKMVK